jgi:hypothetical protein
VRFVTFPTESAIIRFGIYGNKLSMLANGGAQQMRLLVVALAILGIAAVACGGGDSGGGSSGGGSTANNGGSAAPREGGNNCVFTSELASFEDQVVILCGTVGEGLYNPEQKRNSVLYFDGPRGSETARAVLEGAIRASFLTPPEERFGQPGTMICVQGKVSIVDGIPQVFVNNMQNIVFLDELVVTGRSCNGAGTN